MKTLKLSGNMVTIPIDRQTDESQPAGQWQNHGCAIECNGTLVATTDIYSSEEQDFTPTDDDIKRAGDIAQAMNEHAALVAVAEAFDKWYCESSHICELIDSLKVSGERKTELELLRNLLNASIKLNTLRK